MNGGLISPTETKHMKLGEQIHPNGAANNEIG